MPGTWPFIPDHISEDLPELTGQGIVSNRHLQGYETIFCGNLGYPTTIIEFSPDGKAVRTDSRLDRYLIRPTCTLFRELTSGRYCRKCDEQHACIFRGLRRQDLATELASRVKRSNYIKHYVDSGGSWPEVIHEGSRVFLQYECPLLGYGELIFPIFFEDHVIATILLGEICLQGREASVSEIRERFFSSHPDCFDSYSGREAKKCRKQIGQANTSLWRSSYYVLSAENYQRLVRDADEEIKVLEKTLEEQVWLKRDTYIKKHIDKAVAGLHSSLPTNLDIRENYLEQLWNAVGERLKDLAKAFGFEYIAIFARSHPFYPADEPLPLATSAGETPWKQPHEMQESYFNASCIPKDSRVFPQTSRSQPVLLEGLPDGVGKTQDHVTVFTYPAPFHEEMPLVIVVGHDAQTEPAQFDSLDAGLRTFEGVVVAILASLLEALAEEKTRASYRIFGHETGQLTPGLVWIAEFYLASPENLWALSDEKADDLSRDIQAYVAQLKYLFDNASRLLDMMWTLREVTKTSFLALGELLHKWKDIYRLETVKKAIQIAVPPATPGDPDRPSVWGDLSLLELLLYNLINNAVKFCHRGTNIHLDCRKPSGETAHTLTVTDYGRAMPPGESYFDLFVRGSEDSEISQGLGIGLFLARRIALAHGGKIAYNSRRVSDYNVPLIQPYLDRNFEGKNPALCRILDEESRRLKQTGEFSQIVAITDQNIPLYDEPTRKELVDGISIPTFEVTVAITIPRKEA